jgi:uncharacterized protein (DUF58 family)
VTGGLDAKGLRMATLVFAPLLAALSMTAVPNAPWVGTAMPVLLTLWFIMHGALTARVIYEGYRPREDSPDIRTAWDHFDVLTATGASMMWMSVVALFAASVTGWASLSVVGMLGLGAVHLTVLWTAFAAGGDAPWRRAAIARAILPELAIEGDALREEVRITGVVIPAGMRLFATGWTTLHGATTRYAVGADASRAELRLESDLGAATRGEHRAPPLTLWLGDVLGLTRTPAVHRGEARFLVLPRQAVVRGVHQALGAGGDDAISRPARQQPSDGTFRIRAYVPGDDMRRIHWVRSLQINSLVVRLPDEIPHADPDVRLVLDNELRGTDSLTCRAPHDLLDTLVRVWLGIARTLAEAGSRVTLVAAVDHAGAITALERPMIARSPAEALRLGGRVAWQGELPLTTLLTDHPTKQVIVSSRPRQLPSTSKISWIVVPEAAWMASEAMPATPSAMRLPFPLGSADNRGVRRRRERRRLEAIAQDRALFSQVMCWTDLQRWSGHVVARPNRGDVQLEVIP